LLLGQQLQDLLALCSARPFVCERSIKGDILPGKKSVETHCVDLILVRHFPVSHALSVPLWESAPANTFNGTARSALR
jgi:hypothetical protein